jgi:uncharacterized protein YdeI (YjbR/CyaY-like superfamily)
VDDITNLLADYDDTVQIIARRLRDLVLDVMPQANEIVTGHKNISYSTDAGMMKGGMVYIAPFKDSVNLGFVDGIDLPDPDSLLAGTGKRLRHIKFRSLAEVNARERAILDLLHAARDMKAG